MRHALLAGLLLLFLLSCQKQNAGGPGTYEVVITSYDQDRKITAVKAVRDTTGVGLAEAKASVENAPSTPKKRLTEDQARSLAKTLEASGVKTKVTKE